MKIISLFLKKITRYFEPKYKFSTFKIQIIKAKHPNLLPPKWNKNLEEALKKGKIGFFRFLNSF